MRLVHDYLSKKIPKGTITIRRKYLSGHYIDFKITKEEREAFRILLNSEIVGETIFCFSRRFGLSARQLAIIIGSLEK